MNNKFRYRYVVEAATVLAIIAIVMAIPGIPMPVQVISTYMEKVTKSEPYTVVETQMESVTRAETIMDWKKNINTPYFATLQSYLLICFSLYSLESPIDICPRSSNYVLETGGNLQRQKLNAPAEFNDSSLIGTGKDGSICVPKSGRKMQNCQLTATWNMNQSYDWESQSYTYTNCPFVSFHNSPLLIPISLGSNPATVTIYSPQDWQDSGCKGHLHLDLDKVDSSKIWFSMRLPPESDQYTFNIDDLQLVYTWDENILTSKPVTKYRNVPVQVEKQRTVTDYQKISVWQRIFAK